MSNPLRLFVGVSLLLGMVGCKPQVPFANEAVLTVTDKGFEPQNLRVHEGQPVVLTITRKSDSTCATEIVIDEYKVDTKLPLNETVKVSFTPTKAGDLKYGCAMQKMIGGIISVE